MRDLDIVVVGAGIGGLTAAIALRRGGHRVRVFEAASELRPVGAGISLWSNGVKVLDALGLGAEVAAIGGRMERMGYRTADGTPLCEFSLEPLVARVGEHPYPVRRSDLQALLLASLDGAVVSMGRRCVGIEERDDVVAVAFEDGTWVEADLVVAADGTHSHLRAHVVGQPVERTYLGYHNWNGLVPNEVALGSPTTWMMHVGDGHRVSTMPVRDGQYGFFDVPLADPTPLVGDYRSILREHFAGWDDRVSALIEAMDPSGVANVVIYTHEPLDRFARGRVALLGDAAHTSAPDLGQGGCMAMEDGLVLAGYLTTTNVGVADALARYSAERVPRAADILRRATDRARMSHQHDKERTQAWYESLDGTDGRDIVDGICRSIELGPCR